MPKYLNSFKNPEYREEVIVAEDGSMIGTIRIKPSSILWKPKSAREFYAVSLEAFAAWITSTEAKAKKAKR
jgi:hypothetical protein